MGRNIKYLIPKSQYQVTKHTYKSISKSLPFHKISIKFTTGVPTTVKFTAKLTTGGILKCISESSPLLCLKGISGKF